MNNKRRIYLSAALTLAAGSVSAQDAGGVNAPLFQIGSVEVRPNAAYTFQYDDNIFLIDNGAALPAGAVQKSDIQHILMPGVTLGAGDYRGQSTQYFSATYNANINLFQENSGADSTDHQGSVSFGGGDKLSWRFDQTLVSQSDADVTNLQAGGRQKRRAWTSTLSTIYDLSDKTDLESSFGYVLNDFDSATTFDSQRVQGNLFVDYEQTAKLHYGLGATFGYDQVDVGANSVYEQVNTRMVWAATAKFAMRAGVGIEFRQFQGINLDRDNFIFDIGADWKVSPLTVASIGAMRAIAPGNANPGNGGNSYVNRTGVNATLVHKIGERYTASLNAGYLGSDTRGTLTTGGTAEDDYFYIRPGLAARLGDRSSLQLFYQYRQNDNTNAAGGAGDFENNQFGGSLSYTF